MNIHDTLVSAPARGNMRQEEDESHRATPGGIGRCGWSGERFWGVPAAATPFGHVKGLTGLVLSGEARLPYSEGDGFDAWFRNERLTSRPKQQGEASARRAAASASQRPGAAMS